MTAAAGAPGRSDAARHSQAGQGAAAAPPRLRIGYVLGATSGGTGLHVEMLARECAAGGAAVTVYGPTASAAFPSFAAVGISDRPRPLRDLAAILRLRRMIARAGHGVVHAHGMRAGAFAALALTGLRPRPRLVVTAHNARPAARMAGTVHALLERVVARRADAVTCVSSDLAARMDGLGARVAGRAVVPAPPREPPPPAAVSAARAELGAGGRPVVLAVGRLAAQKGFGTLLSSAARWQGRSPRPLLAIAGEGPLERRLRAQADRDLIAVSFLGRRDDVPALLAAADVVVVPSRWEGQPLFVQEALRAGRPVVAFRVGGIPELTGEDAALLVRPGDPAALAAAVLAVLDDPALAAALGKAARARAAALPTAREAAAAALRVYREGRARRAGRPGGRPQPRPSSPAARPPVA